jgi:acetyl-CoA/propionyl-CoA carboxylase biotin carboxyl carrier protein
VRDPVLIANRGEIAVRVARTVHALGLRSVAVFADDDAGAVHVDACDVAVRVGSYLDGAELLAAAARAGARAVHPGYGFLSENAEFAAAVLAAGLVWIGPPPAAIAAMGDKARAKALAREAGVPVLEDVPVAAVRSFGFPVMVKAVAGGGGKGMRVVRAEGELAGALDAARREAQAAFGDGRLLVERFLERPRHLEVQVLADRYGTCVHFGERECSLQRRHQKVVEEAPSPVVDPARRAELGTAAVALARACGYEGAGTVEFIAEGADFWFLEMNTRLQVEHPVTELVYGVDLVELQLRVAAGERLAPASPREPDGHAVEARIYAEDPAAGFLPATGTVRAYREPAGARVDSGIRLGSEVGTAYDPLLAKVVVHGPDRATALRRLDRALSELEVLGVATNAAFTRALLARDDVQAGDQDTGLLERALAQLDLAPPDDLLPAAALAAFVADTEGLTVPPGSWRRRFTGHGEVAVRAVAGERVAEVAVGDRAWRAAGRRLDAGALRITLDGVSRRYVVARDGDGLWIARDGHQLELRTERPDRTGTAAPPGSLEAPMPGTVLLVNVANGDAVGEGDVLLVLESMKMELAISAPHAGTVEGLELAPGDRVALRQPLVEVTP